MNTYNEEARLASVVASAEGVDEIVVADMASTDNTRDVAIALGARVIDLPNAGFCEPGRMPAISAATSEWVLLLDADERLSKEGLPKIRELLAQTPDGVVAYRLPRVNFLGSRAIRGSGWGLPAELQSRLFRRTTVEWPSKIHAQPEFDGVVLDLPGDGPIRIEHDNFADLEQMLGKLNRYTTIEAKQLLEAGPTTSLIMGLRFGLEELVTRYEPDVDGPMSLVVSLAMLGYRFDIQAKAAEARGWPDEPVIGKQSLRAAVNAMWSVLRQRELNRAAAALEQEDDEAALVRLRAALHLWSDMPPTLSDLTVDFHDDGVTGPWAELSADGTARVARLIEETVATRVAAHAHLRAQQEASVKLDQVTVEAEEATRLFNELAPVAEAAALRLRDLELQLAAHQELIAALTAEGAETSEDLASRTAASLRRLSRRARRSLAGANRLRARAITRRS